MPIDTRIQMTGASSSSEDDWKATALRFRAQRQALIASNIANADTPGYQAKDASFSDALSQQQAESRPIALNSTSLGHMRSQGFSGTGSTLDFARLTVVTQPSADRNTVDADVERASFAKNSILYQLAIGTMDDETKEFMLASSDPRK